MGVTKTFKIPTGWYNQISEYIKHVTKGIRRPHDQSKNQDPPSSIDSFRRERIRRSLHE
ncbi:MAG: hypothetical protein ACXAEX_04660 [Promethearchaeota archaeon]